MNWQLLNNQTFAENIGWTLVHSLWQISLVAFLLLVSLKILKNSSSNLRYLLCVSALFLTLAMPVATFFSFPANETRTENIPVTQDAKNAANSFTPPAEPQKDTTKIPSEPVKTEKDGEIASANLFENFEKQMESFLAAFLPYLVWFWFLGILLFSLRLCGGIRQTRRIKTNKVSAVGEEWREKFAYLCEKMGVRQKVGFIRSEIVETPLVIGWLKPFVIVPSSVLTGLSPRELETIIAHELAHIRRHDYLINILQSFVEIILFFHPLTWWISSQIRRERENACDDEVLEIFNGEPLLYANALANLETFRFRKGDFAPSNAMTANGGNLVKRIQRIISGNRNNNRKESFRSGIPVFLFVTGFLALVSVAYFQVFASGEEIKNDLNQKKIAVSLYNASTVIPSENTPEEDEKTMRRVIAKLKQHNIPTTGFLIGGNFNIRAENIPADQQKTVSLWREAGFEFGVLDLKYPKSFDSTVTEYQAALKSREEKLEPFIKKQMDFIKEYRKSDPRKDSTENIKKQTAVMKESLEQVQNAIKEWMKENNLTQVKYTFGMQDWIYAYTYDIARRENDRQKMNRIKTQYLDYMAKSLEYYERYSNYLFEREIPQNIPLMPSRLLADSADELFAMFQNRGYRFVSVDEAMQDDAYLQNDSVLTGGMGSSWLESLAFQQRKPFLDRVNVDVDVLKIWDENQPVNRKIITK